MSDWKPHGPRAIRKTVNGTTMTVRACNVVGYEALVNGAWIGWFQLRPDAINCAQNVQRAIAADRRARKQTDHPTGREERG